MNEAHLKYRTAVETALGASGIVAQDTWSEGDETRELELFFVFEDGGYLHRSCWPNGVTVSWNQYDGWQYAAATRSGALEEPRELVTGLTPPPELVAEAISRVLSGRLYQLPCRSENSTTEPIQAALEAAIAARDARANHPSQS